MKLLLFLFLLFFFQMTLAMEMVGALSAGMGGTGRAAINSNESLYLNPATIALVDRFYSGASYQTGFTDQNISRNTYSVNLTDGTPGTAFPGSFGYRRHKIKDSRGVITENEFKVALGYRLTDRFSLGLGVSHLNADDHGRRAQHKQTNGDIGLLFGLMPNWGLSINAENIIEAKKSLPLALQRRSQAALGTQYIFRTFITARYEAIVPLYAEIAQKIGHRVGLGVDLQNHFRLNLGFSNDDNTSQNWSSVGLAWMGPRLRLAYSFQDESRLGLGERHLVDLWFDI